MNCIYKITNLKNKKFYIGSTVNFKNRISKHFLDFRKQKHSNIYLQRSYNKYGKDNFQVEIVEKCNVDILLNREQYYIDTLKPHYNIAKIAGNTLGIKRSMSSRLKQSNSMKGHKHSEQTKAKISKSNCGKKLSEERKLNIKLSKQYISQDTRNKIRLSRIGKPYKGTSPTSKNITILNLESNIILQFKSIKEASRELKIPSSSISRSLKLDVITNKIYKVKLS